MWYPYPLQQPHERDYLLQFTDEEANVPQIVALHSAIQLDEGGARVKPSSV